MRELATAPEAAGAWEGSEQLRQNVGQGWKRRAQDKRLQLT